MKAKSNPFLRLSLAFISAITFQQVQAADTFWDIDGTISGPGSTTPSGAWNGTNTFWNTDTAGGAGTLSADPGTANTAVFSAGTTATGNFTVTASGTRVAQGLNFQEGGNIQLTGGLISLTGSAASGDANGLIQTGPSMTGTATIDSNIQVNTATNIILKLVAGNGAAATDLLLNGSISSSPGANYQLRLGGAGNGRITSNLGTALNTAVQQGNSSWAGTWTIAGNQTWGASSGITFSSSATFGASGKLVLGDSTSDIQSIGSAGIIAGNATQTTPLTINSTLTTTGALNVRVGTVEVAGTLNAVALNLGNTGPTSGTLRLSDGTTAGSATFTGDVSFGSSSGNKIVGGAAGTSVLTLNRSVDDALTTAVVLGGAGTNDNNLRLVKQNVNTLTISGANTFTGSTTVEGGILLLSNQNGIQSSTLTLSGGTANFSSSVVGNAFTVGGLAGATNLALQNTDSVAIALSVGGNNENASYSGILSGAGSLIKNGNGTQTLSNASNSFTGAVNVNSGKLSAASLGGFASSRTFTLNGGTLSYSGSANVSQNNLALSVTANSVLEVTDSAATLRSGGTLSGSGQLTINGPGTVALGQNAANASYGNGFTGDIVVSNGATLSLRNQNSMGSTAGGVATGTTTIQSGGTLLLDPFSQTSITFNSESIAFQGSSTLTNRLNGQTSLTTALAGSISTASTLTVNTREDVTTSNAVSLELSGVITGNGGIDFGSGGGRAGNYVLSNTNGYLGATNVNSGTLAINGNQSAANGNVTASNTGSRLVGIGTIGGDTTINSGAIHSAGGIVANVDKVGVQTFDETGAATTNLSYTSGSIFEWDLNANKDTDGLDNDFDAVADNGVAGTDYDAVNVSGNLTVDAAAVFKVIQGSGTTFTDTFWTQNQSWSNIFTVTGATTSGWSTTAVSVYNTSNVLQDVTSYGAFTITGTTLTWSAVPEPTSAFAGLLIGAGLLRRRRKA